MQSEFNERVALIRKATGGSILDSTKYSKLVDVAEFAYGTLWLAEREALQGPIDPSVLSALKEARRAVVSLVVELVSIWPRCSYGIDSLHKDDGAPAAEFDVLKSAGI